MKKYRYALLLLVAAFITTSCFSEDKQSDENEGATELNEGHLFIIGGGDRPDSLMTQFLALGGGSKAHVLVVPFASSDIEDTGSYQQEQFARLGCASSQYVNSPKKLIDSEESLAKLDGITAVFFSGGDQNRLTDYLKGTKFLAKIRDIYQNGGVIGGTSAGAAVMSKIMLTGEEENVPDKYKGDFSYIKQGNVQTADGFGFIDSAIIDQHFIIRKRQNRLISLVLQHRMKGIGIDEATAIIVNPKGSFRVAGQSQVMVFEPEAEPSVSPTGYLKTNSLTVRILTAGDTYQL